jgi:hypothetical protein
VSKMGGVLGISHVARQEHGIAFAIVILEPTKEKVVPYVNFVNVDLDKLIPTMPIYQPLVDALMSDTPEERTIPVAALRIEPEFRAPDWILNIFVDRFAKWQVEKEEFMFKVLVMERSDGSYWVYDDQAYVEAAQKLKPELKVRCDVYKDPTR